MDRETDNDQQAKSYLLALLQGQLDSGRTVSLADDLAAQPERVAELLADVKNADALRLALFPPDDPLPAELVAQAQRLKGRLQTQRVMRRMAPIAAGVILFVAGWTGHTGHAVWQASGPVGAPALVEAALDAQAALELRHRMVSQPESAVLNSQEIVAELGIDLLKLPDDWTVRDVQIVATPDRPGVAIAVDAPYLGRILVMVVARNADDIQDPLTTFEYEGQTVAMFEHGRSAFVLVDEYGHPEQLAQGADLLLSLAN